LLLHSLCSARPATVQRRRDEDGWKCGRARDNELDHSAKFVYLHAGASPAPAAAGAGRAGTPGTCLRVIVVWCALACCRVAWSRAERGRERDTEREREIERASRMVAGGTAWALAPNSHGVPLHVRALP
jgi:hypothetical protein